ncbi:hypothetical protein DPMN_050270 [Dreissena polymorpha]|uniref:Uncharacterized protein n=1 Tax=Dreissena polymorpha TaxID=45954 RepID=A0A9D4HP40_DREPO|nr:hypothetical protein DPMN_050270 [Dreissena polymorpha]
MELHISAGLSGTTFYTHALKFSFPRATLKCTVLGSQSEGSLGFTGVYNVQSSAVRVKDQWGSQGFTNVQPSAVRVKDQWGSQGFTNVQSLAVRVKDQWGSQGFTNVQSSAVRVKDHWGLQGFTTVLGSQSEGSIRVHRGLMYSPRQSE